MVVLTFAVQTVNGLLVSFIGICITSFHSEIRDSNAERQKPRDRRREREQGKNNCCLRSVIGGRILFLLFIIQSDIVLLGKSTSYLKMYGNIIQLFN